MGKAKQGKSSVKSVVKKADVPALRLEYRSPAELQENGMNWRTHPEAQVAALTDVIADVGWAGACLYNEATGRLIDGHARRKVALEQGSDKVPVLVGSWTEEQERKILATLDPLAAMAEADKGKLEELLRSIESDGNVKAMLDELAQQERINLGANEPGAGGDDFDATPDDGPTRTAVGDLWLIDGGKHRLLVGDCTVAKNVERVMEGERAGLCFTSPPYGCGNVAKLRDHYERGAPKRESFYESHDDKPAEWPALMDGWYATVRPVVDAVICNVQMLADNKRAMIQFVAERADELVDVIVWDKVGAAPQMQRNVLSNVFEFLFVFGGNGSRSIPFADWHGTLSNVVRIDPRGGNNVADIHRAVMPLGLPLWVLGELCPEAKSVVDPFAGSGTTIIAAHRLGRRCFGCEISPTYCDVILRRVEAEGMTVERAESDAKGQ